MQTQRPAAGDRPGSSAESEPFDCPPPPRAAVSGDPPLAGLPVLSPAHPPNTLPADGSGALPRAGLPSAVPGYEVLEVLGRGGMGVVYKARQVQLQRVVALKMILAGVHAGGEERVRFLAEAEAVARLQHPNVVQIFETGTHDGLPFMALEFVSGGNLADKVQDASLPPREAAAVVEQLARGMAEAHSRGVVHRDLKPANVLLAADGTPKITDFGLAKRITGEPGASGHPEGRGGQTGLTVSGAIVGTPSYMAPEQAAGRSKEVGPAADVYALGAILYRLLTGRPPFQAATTLDTLRQVLTEEPVPPAQLQRGLPRDLETVCLRALEKDPVRRYASAAALAEELRRFLAGEPVQARPVSGWERGWRWVKRRPGAAALVGVTGLLLLALVGLVVGGLAYDQVQTARQTAEAEREEARRQKAEADRQRGAAETAQKEADRQRDRAEMALYVNRLTLAQRDIEKGEFDRAAEVLEQCRWDLRGWEWRHLRGAARRIHCLRGHTGNVDSVAFSPDGKRLASGAGDPDDPGKPGELKVWDAQTGQELLSLQGHTQAVRSGAFSPDGKRIASGSKDQTVRVWDAQTGRQVLDLKGNKGEVTSVCFSPDGRRIAGASGVATPGHGGPEGVTVWDAQTGQEVLPLKGHTDRVWSVAFSPDGKRLAGGGGPWDAQKGEWAPGTAVVSVWDVSMSTKGQQAGGQEVLAIKGGHTGYVWGVAFSPDGKRIASGSKDQTVRVWDAQSGQQLRELRGHTGSVNSVAFSSDGKRIVSGSDDRTVKVWDAQGGQQIFSFMHRESVGSVAFSPDGQRIASGSDDRTVKVWDISTSTEGRQAGGQEVVTPRGHTGRVFSVCFSPDGTRLAGGSEDTTVRVWDAHSGQQFLALKGHREWVGSVAFSPDGKRLASGSNDKTVKLWDAQSGQEILTLEGHTGRVESVVFSPDGTRLASGSWDKTVRVWELQSGQQLLALQGHTRGVESVAFSPDSQRLASGANDGVKVWDVHSGEQLLTLKGHTEWVASLAFSPDGTRIAGVGGAWDAQKQHWVSGEARVSVWDARTGQQVLALTGHTAGVLSVAFSPDGQRIASGSIDRTVKVWDAQSGQELLDLPGHPGLVWSVAFSPDGTRLASSSGYASSNNPGEVKVWAAQTGQGVLALHGHTDRVSSVAFSPDGKRLLSLAHTRAGDELKSWDLVTGLALPPGTEPPPPDGQRTAVSPDGRVRAWINGDRVQVLRQPVGNK